MQPIFERATLKGTKNPHSIGKMPRKNLLLRMYIPLSRMSHGCRNLLLATKNLRLDTNQSPFLPKFAVKKTASLLTLGQRFKHHGSRLTAALPVKKRKQYEHQHPRGHCRILVCRHPGVVLPPRRHRGQCHRIRLRRLLLGAQRPH